MEHKADHGFAAADILKVEVEIFDVAYHIIGGGEEGEKTAVQTKEEADHSLPYLVAVAILDGEVMPEQYEPERIRRRDVQELLRKITVRPSAGYSGRFPAEMACSLKVSLRDGTVLVKEKRDYEGFHTRPMSWEAVKGKFERLSRAHADSSLRAEIVAAVHDLEDVQAEELMRFLARVQ